MKTKLTVFLTMMILSSMIFGCSPSTSTPQNGDISLLYTEAFDMFSERKSELITIDKNGKTLSTLTFPLTQALTIEPLKNGDYAFLPNMSELSENKIAFLNNEGKFSYETQKEGSEIEAYRDTGNLTYKILTQENNGTIIIKDKAGEKSLHLKGYLSGKTANDSNYIYVLATVKDKKELNLIDQKTYKLVKTFPLPVREVSDLLLINDQLVITSFNNQFYVLNTKNWQIKSIKLPFRLINDGDPLSNKSKVISDGKNIYFNNAESIAIYDHQFKLNRHQLFIKNIESSNEEIQLTQIHGNDLYILIQNELSESKGGTLKIVDKESLKPKKEIPLPSRAKNNLHVVNFIVHNK